MTNANETTPDPEREPSTFWLSVSVASCLILAYLVTVITGHAVYHAFPADCHGGSLTSCGGVRTTSIILAVAAAYFLDVGCIIMASYVVLDYRGHSRTEHLIALCITAITLALSLLSYGNVKTLTHSGGLWNIGLLADLILVSGGLLGFVAVITYQTMTNQFHPVRNFQAKRRRRA